ncbi:MAG: nucleotide exchange factor GrpE [Candidatus Micrarchaeota archaeon]
MTGEDGDNERTECGQDELERAEQGKEQDISGNLEEKKECGEESGLEKLKKENLELTNDLKRLQAEFENYQKRTEREKGEVSGRGRGVVLMKFISLADEFEAAETHMHTSGERELRNGIRLLHKKLENLLEEEGVIPIESLGKKFDPDRCDAVELVESEGEEGVVAKEMRKGYIYDGRVLRHAIVGVTKKPKGQEKPAEEPKNNV